MRDGRGRFPIPWGLLIVVGMFGPGPVAVGDALRPDWSTPRTPRTLGAFPHAADDPADRLAPGFDPGISESLPRVLPPPDFAISEPPWQPPPSVPTHLPELARVFDPKIYIPEPASIVLLTTGLIGLIARRALRRMRV